MMTFRFFFCFIIGTVFSTYAQDRLDLFTLSGHYGFPSKYDSVYNSKAQETGVMMSLVAPVKISEKTIWYNSLNYFYWNVNNEEDMPDQIINPIDVHGLILRTGVYHKFENGRAIQLLLVPRLMTDFKNVDSDHFQWGGIAVYEKRYKKSLKMGFGAMYNQEFFGPYMVPLVNLDWHINSRWSYKGLLPVFGKLTYKVNDELNIGWSHFGLTTTYRLGNDNYRGDYLERKSIDESLYARYRLFGDFFLEGRFGYALGRSYKQYEADQKVDFSIPLLSFGDDRIAKNVSFNDGVIASLRVVYSIDLNEQ